MFHGREVLVLLELGLLKCLMFLLPSVALVRLNEADKAEAKKAREEKEDEKKREQLGSVLTGLGLKLAQKRFGNKGVGATKAELLVAKQEAQAAAEAAATATAGEGSAEPQAPANLPVGPGVGAGVPGMMNGPAAAGAGDGDAGAGPAARVGAGGDASSPFMQQQNIKAEPVDEDMPDAAAAPGGGVVLDGLTGGVRPSEALGGAGASSQLGPGGGEGPSGALADDGARRTFQEQLVSVRLPQGAVGGAGAGASGYGDGKQVLDVRDLMEAMSRDPLYCKSEQLYRLYATASLPK